MPGIFQYPKRLFGLIGSGTVVAAIIGGLSVSSLVGVIGTSNLLLVSFSGLLFSLIVLDRILKKYADRLQVPDQKDEDIEKDYQDHGRSVIMEKISLEKKQGGCQCATKNPKGR